MLTRPIMIVEDSETQALKLRLLLEQEGWDVIRASSAESALEELNQNIPSLIVADYHLPGVRGDELCRRIRMNVSTRNIPILMLTVDDAEDSVRGGLDSGADDYVSKSVASDILLIRVRSLLRKSEELPSLSSQESYFRRARILAIDDSPTYLESLAETLGNEGYEITKASNGEAGLASIDKESFDCVIVDLVMPNIDGIEVCRRISETKNIAAPAMIIMLTSSETKEDMTRGLEAGADDFVAKSGDMTVLKARIRALLRRKFFLEEHRRIVEELNNKELEAAEARAARDLAQTRATLVEELERKNRELEAFSYSVSHDLRAPLRSIDGFSKTLLEEYSGKLDDTAQHYLNRVCAGARRMGDLIDDLLQLSKVGRAELHRTRIDLSALAQAVSGELHRAAPDRTVEVQVQQGVSVEADRGLLQVVLENLFGNAWKFTGGQVEAAIIFGVEMRDGHPVYFVKDNGAGFDMAYASRLFSPFQRLHSQTSFPGTGIGLATVHRIIDRHGGRVWAESAVGQGATFYWTLGTSRMEILA